MSNNYLLDLDYPGPHITCKSSEIALIITCLDEKLDKEQLISTWSNEVQKAIAKNPKKNVIINFENVKILTSPALRELVMYRCNLNIQKLKIGLCGLNESLVEVIKMTCIDFLFTIADSEEAIEQEFRRLSGK